MHKAGGKHWFHRYDWDAVAGIVAAATALILHLFHIVQPDILLTMTLVLVALLLLRQLRHEEREERVETTAVRTEEMIITLRDALKMPDVVLVGPRHLKSASEAFATRSRRHGLVQCVPDDVPAARAFRLPAEASGGKSARYPHHVRAGRK